MGNSMLYYDLHLHSCLSPCGDREMTVNNIANMAALKGLSVVALTDHNSCKNCPAFLDAARVAGIRALPGMELCTSEEIHLVCLFPHLENAMAFDDYVFRRLPAIPNRPDIFGEQLILDGQDQVIGQVEPLLISAADISITQVSGLMKDFGGAFFPAHIDKSSYSVTAVFGLIPEDCGIRAVEYSHNADGETLHQLQLLNPMLESLPAFYNSDAHYLWDIAEPEHAVEEEFLELFLGL